MDTIANQAFQQLLGPENVILDANKIKQYTNNTLNLDYSISAILIINHENLLPEIMMLANQYKLPCYPISTGNNWGYGCGVPSQNDCLILDLSRLSSIELIDAKCGLVSIQPGVTQQMLYEFLLANNLEFLVPTTGAGPNCSIIGNALERGFGIAPITDHASAFTSYEAILPNGDQYTSALHALGCKTLSHYYRWGVGPHLDGLFSQSNYAIITRATLALKPRIDELEMFYVGIKEDLNLEWLIEKMQHIQQKFTGNIHSFKIANSHKITAASGGITSMSWISIGGIYGDKKIVRVIKNYMRKMLRGKANKVIFLNRKKIAIIQKLLLFIPSKKIKNTLMPSVIRAQYLLDLLAGIPNESDVGSLYNKVFDYRKNNHLNPSDDDIGIIWFPPLVPMNASKVRQFIAVVEKVMNKFKLAPAIALTSLSDYCFCGVIPIRFNKNSIHEYEQAWQVHEELFNACYDAGFYPYRMNIHSMQKLDLPPSIYRKARHAIKRALDPNNILSPGRY